jgi:type I restriction enzyme S subunit
LDLCKRSSTGNTHRKYLNEGIFLNHELAIPSIEEQQKALVACKAGNKRVEKVQHEITQQQSHLAKLKQAILQEAIQGKLTADWRAAHPDVEPASQLLHRIQAEKARLIATKKLRPEKPLPKITPAEIPFEIPKGWEWCRASNIGFVIGGLTKNAAKRGGHKRLLPYLRVANVYANRLDLSDLQEIGVTDSEVEKLLLEKDDLLVVEGNGSRDQVGRIARWDALIDPCVHQNHVIKVRLGEPKVAPWALYWFLSPTGRVLIEEQARTSTGLYNLSTGKVANLPIPLPPLAEQAAIVERVEMLMTTCRALEAEIEHARTHAAHLLQSVLKEAFAPAA